MNQHTRDQVENVAELLRDKRWDDARTGLGELYKNVTNSIETPLGAYHLARMACMLQEYDLQIQHGGREAGDTLLLYNAAQWCWRIIEAKGNRAAWRARVRVQRALEELTALSFEGFDTAYAARHLDEALTLARENLNILARNLLWDARSMPTEPNLTPPEQAPVSDTAPEQLRGIAATLLRAGTADNEIVDPNIPAELQQIANELEHEQRYDEPGLSRDEQKRLGERLMTVLRNMDKRAPSYTFSDGEEIAMKLLGK